MQAFQPPVRPPHPPSKPARLRKHVPPQEPAEGLSRRASTGISRTVLVAALPFGSQMNAEAAGTAIGQGLRERGLAVDVYPLGDLAADFDVRMKAARAVVIFDPRLDEQTLLASLPFEIATRARQAGVPCYAVTRKNALDPFDARILDLQVVIEARSRRSLRAAGLALAEVL
jgi:hypothetical protein